MFDRPIGGFEERDGGFLTESGTDMLKELLDYCMGLGWIDKENPEAEGPNIVFPAFGEKVCLSRLLGV